MRDEAAHTATIQRAASILAELGHEIETLGAELSADPAFAQRHLSALQSIDLIAQQQHAIAALLQADCAASGVERITLDGLQQRLRA